MTTAVISNGIKYRSSIASGALSGIAGGVIFGIMMAMMGSIRMIAEMMGSESLFVGWVIHLMISAVFGIGYGLIFSKRATTSGNAIGMGMIYGVVLWVFGPLFMMPILMGMSSMIFHIGGMQWMSLVGHLMYGVVTALVFLKTAR